MVTTKRKKNTKYHGHVTHGGGSRKKRRGAGSRGGRGNAGTGKRAGHKKAGISRKLGAKGFTFRGRANTNEKGINVGSFTKEKLQKLVETEKVTQDGDTFTIDMTKLGYSKLLGTGSVSFKLKILVSKCSAIAAQKINEAGGEIVSESVKPTAAE